MSDFAFLARPVGPLFFGQPASFSAGEAHGAWSQFPPSPRTFQGMVRSHLLRTAAPPLDLNDWSASARSHRESLIGPGDRLPAGWQLRGPWPVQIEAVEEGLVAEPWLPLPRFVVAAGRELARLRPIAGGLDWLSDDPSATARFGLPGRAWKAAPTTWVSAANLAVLLTGQGAWNPKGRANGLPPFVVWEPHTGLALEPGEPREGGGGNQLASDPKTAQDGMLYTRGNLRFESASGLAGELSIPGGGGGALRPEALATGSARLGRGGAPLTLAPLPPLSRSWTALLAGRHLPAALDEDDRFWLLALSPFAVEAAAGGRSGAAPLGGLDSRLGDCELIPEAALPGPPLTLGGFDLAAGRARDNRLYLPAGSAFLVRLRGGTPEARAFVLRQLHSGYHLGDAGERGFGFGHVVASAPLSILDHHELQGACDE